MDDALIPLRRKGIWVFNYPDNCVATVVPHLAALGLCLDAEKSRLASASISGFSHHKDLLDPKEKEGNHRVHHSLHWSLI